MPGTSRCEPFPIGRKVCKLTIIGERVYRSGNAAYPCRCDCGNEVVRTRIGLSYGKRPACNECNKRRRGNRKHCLSTKHLRELGAWTKMRQRCYNPNDSSYRHYGAKGVKVCDRWNKNFGDFVADMGFCPENSGMGLCRRDKSSDFTPDNCFWGYPRRAARGSSSPRVNTPRVEHDGQLLTLHQWAQKAGIRTETLKYRVEVKKMPMSEALKPGRVGIQRRYPTTRHQDRRILALHASGWKAASIAHRLGLRPSVVDSRIRSTAIGNFGSYEEDIRQTELRLIKVKPPVKKKQAVKQKSPLTRPPRVRTERRHGHQPGDVVGGFLLKSVSETTRDARTGAPIKHWLTECCSCGNLEVRLSTNLGSKSCGCLPHPWTRSVEDQLLIDKHPHEYACWCRAKANARQMGIEFYESWKVFGNFIADVGLCPDKSKGIYREVADKGYLPGNVLWSLRRAIRKRLDPIIEIDGVEKQLWEWLEHFGVSRARYMGRTQDRGYDPVSALTTPFRRFGKTGYCHLGHKLAKTPSGRMACNICSNRRQKRFRADNHEHVLEQCAKYRRRYRKREQILDKFKDYDLTEVELLKEKVKR